MRSRRRSSRSEHCEAAVCLLLMMGLGCQALVDVSQYRFDGDGGVDTTEQPPPPADDPAAPDDDASETPDATEPGASGPVAETPPSPPLSDTQPPVDAGTGSEPSDAEQNEPALPPDDPEPPPDPGLPPMDPEPEPEPPPPDPPPASGDNCSIVEWCDVPASPDGVLCTQTGCSVEAAVAECRAEMLGDLCGNPPPPFVLNTLDGGRVEFQ